MALVKQLRYEALEKDTRHTEADCTYSVITATNGDRLLQIDTYGSKTRRILGKKSQSIRFTSEALRQLRSILNEQFP